MSRRDLKFDIKILPDGSSQITCDASVSTPEIVRKMEHLSNAWHMTRIRTMAKEESLPNAMRRAADILVRASERHRYEGGTDVERIAWQPVELRCAAAKFEHEDSVKSLLTQMFIGSYYSSADEFVDSADEFVDEILNRFNVTPKEAE